MPLVLAPAVPWILGALGVGASHYALPGREEREQAIVDLVDAVTPDLSRPMASDIEAAQTDADQNARTDAVADTCRTCDTDGNPCLVGPYSEIVDQCSQRGGNAHHIVPDRTYRLGSRPSGPLASSTVNRIRGAPTLNDGMSVCLSPAQHTAAHAVADPAVQALGRGSQVTVPGTAPMAGILLASQASISAVPGLHQGCKEQANRAASNQVRAGTGLTAPGRTSWFPPAPLSPASTVLARGFY